MILVSDAQGNIVSSDVENVYQGSNLANTLYFVGPFSSSSSVTVNYSLPNGELIGPYYMTSTDFSEPITDNEGNILNVFSAAITAVITEYAGTATAQISVTTGTQIIASSSYNFTILQGVPNATPQPDENIYQQILNQFSQVNQEITTIQEKLSVKVLVDFTVNSQTGQGVKYYSDGSIAQIQFPTGNPNVIVSSDFLQILAFNSTSFVLEDDGSYSLAFGPAQTNMTNNNFFVGLTKTGTETYKSGVETTPTAKQGEYTLCDTVFKGTDGSVYLTATEPYSGRLLLLSGTAFIQKVVSNVTYANSLFTVTFTDGTNSTLDISGKLNQIESDIPRLYSTIPGNPNSAIGYAATPNAGTIAQRTLSGTVQTANGVENLDAANYGQVMELINGIQLVKINDLQYQLTVNGQSAGTINIPQDQFLKSVTFDPETNILTFVFTTSGGDVTTTVDLSSLIDVYTAGNGLNLSQNQFSVKIDGSSNNALVLTPNGLYVDSTQFESAESASQSWQAQAQINAQKLDKVTTTGNTQVYAVNSQGEQTMLQALSETPESNNIPIYNADGNLVSQDLAENASSSVLTPKGYVDNIKTNLENQLSSVPRTAVNGAATSGESVTVPNTPQTQLNAQDYGTIFTHKRLWNGALYDEGFNQILNPQNYPATTTINGITFTNNGDGTITVNGTPTETPAIFVLASNTLNGKYLMQGCPSGGTMGTYALVKGATLSTYDTGEGIIASLTETTPSNVSIYVWATVNNVVFKPQLIDLTAFENATGNTIGTVSAWNALYPDFYPYVPTVSPVTPLEIVPSGSQSSIVSSGKNLIPFPYAYGGAGDTYTSNGITFTVQADGGIYVKGKTTGSSVFQCIREDNGFMLPSGQYIGSVENGNNISFIARINGQPVDQYISAASVFSLNNENYLKYLYIQITNTQLDFDVVVYPQLESGNVVTPYAPYVAPITTEINYTAVNSGQQSLIDNAVTIGNSISERNGNIITVKTGTSSTNVSDALPNSLVLSNIRESFTTTDGTITVENNETVYYVLNTPVTVEIEEIAPIPTFGDNNTTFTSEAIGTVNAPVIMDFTTYIANNLPKGYALLKDNAGNLIVAYTQTNMLYDVNTEKYISDLINLKDTVTGTIYKLTVTNGAIALVEFTN